MAIGAAMDAFEAAIQASDGFAADDLMTARIHFEQAVAETIARANAAIHQRTVWRYDGRSYRPWRCTLIEYGGESGEPEERPCGGTPSDWQ